MYHIKIFCGTIHYTMYYRKMQEDLQKYLFYDTIFSEVKNLQNKVNTSIRLDKELFEKVKELAKKYNRNNTQQIEYMLKKYIEIQEKD